MIYPENLKYHEKHMWVREDGTTGITDFAQNFLGEILEVRVQPVGTEVGKGRPLGEIEVFKQITDLRAPVSGTIREVNAKVLREPTIINKDPYGEGWIAVIEMAHPEELSELLTSSEYEKVAAAYAKLNLG
jgi:glycine cleavage system H protein